MEFISPAQVKTAFFEENHNCLEIQASDAQIVGSFDDIDENVDEIWILQCKKGTKIKELENQKIKFPGCTKLDEKYEIEAIAASTSKHATFGYANRKHRYALRSLPIAGKILISEPLPKTEIKAVEPTKHHKVPLPEGIKTRHPLLGSNYEKYLKIDDDTRKRLQGLCNVENKSAVKIKTEKTTSKRKRLNADDAAGGKTKLAKIIKTEKADVLEVEEDLKWIKQI